MPYEGSSWAPSGEGSGIGPSSPAVVNETR